MKLTATPFDPETGELLPVYRDAYLRGDLARSSARQVEEYLRKDPATAHLTVTRWYEMKEDDVQPAPGWVKKQLLFIREQPQRFRRRALSLVAGTALVAGASMAATNLPTDSSSTGYVPTELTGEASLAGGEAADAGAARMITVRGRVLSASGKPLVGATVLRKGTYQGVSTDANGNYALRVPANEAAATLQFGYAGYTDQELRASEAADVTLQPRAAKRHNWLFF